MLLDFLVDDDLVITGVDVEPGPWNGSVNVCVFQILIHVIYINFSPLGFFMQVQNDTNPTTKLMYSHFVIFMVTLFVPTIIRFFLYRQFAMEC